MMRRRVWLSFSYQMWLSSGTILCGDINVVCVASHSSGIWLTTAYFSSDLAAFSISPVGQRFEDNIEPKMSRNISVGLDEFE